MGSIRITPRADRAVLLAGLLLLVYGALILTRNASDPRVLRQVAGRSIGGLVLSHGDSVIGFAAARVVYVFDTRCAYCAKQHRHVAALLSALPPGAGLAVSLEPDSSIRDYWVDVAPQLAPPISIAESSLTQLSLPGVPVLLFARAGGVIRIGYIGTVTDWDKSRILREFTETES